MNRYKQTEHKMLKTIIYNPVGDYTEIYKIGLQVFSFVGFYAYLFLILGKSHSHFMIFFNWLIFQTIIYWTEWAPAF